MFVALLALLASVTSLTRAQTYGGYQCDGDRDVVVHLFEWKWTDIQAACPGLASLGYCAVQVSPPQEHVVLAANNYPWWQRYQPVSYILGSRSGTEAEFRNMVSSCNAAGVKIYVDAVINHMTGAGSGTGSAGSQWNGGSDENGQSYPGVPYDELHFNRRDVCLTPDMNVQDYSNPDEVRNCRLYGLRDLAQGDLYVETQIGDYLEKLISLGVSGFRLDAAKHQVPDDIAAILSHVTSGTPFAFLEVIYEEGIDAVIPGEYTPIGRVTEYRFSLKLADAVFKRNGYELGNLLTDLASGTFVPGSQTLMFVDNHDTQRGHGIGGDPATFKMPREYKISNTFLLGVDYGYPKIMSSYEFTDSDQGPPSDGNGNTNDVTCFDGSWVCEHSWPEITSMVNFHNLVRGEPMANIWDNGAGAVAFGRGNKGFVVINNDAAPISENLQTGLPAGNYCDVLACDGNMAPCQGSSQCTAITVAADGTAQFDVANDSNPYRAIHV